MQITQSLDFDSDRAPSADSIIAITFRDPDLYQLQRAKAADWNVLRSGGEDVSQEEFRGLMCNYSMLNLGTQHFPIRRNKKSRPCISKTESSEKVGPFR